MASNVTITATFSEVEANALVRLLNQIGLDDLKPFAVGVDDNDCAIEAYSMLKACEVVRQGLATQGYDLLW